MPALRLAHLYPNHMNLYGDRGNVVCLTARAAWRGIELQCAQIGPGEPFDSEGFDLIFVGGGPDREQQRVADDLLALKADGIRSAVEADVPVLAVCGGYQLLGHSYQPGIGAPLPGLGVFDAHTVHPGHNVPRCIGNLVAGWNGQTLVGFENHGGRTYLGPGCQPLAKVEAGFGNNGSDGGEGAVYRNAFGTYLHGSFLPKNPAFADHLLALALAHAGFPAELPPLDDHVEQRAHQAAVRLALHK